MAIEIVDFPIKNGGSFQFAMLVITRGYMNDVALMGQFELNMVPLPPQPSGFFWLPETRPTWSNWGRSQKNT